MMLKSFHPANKSNQRRLFMAEEKKKFDDTKQAESQREFESEQAMFRHQRELLIAKKKLQAQREGKKLREEDIQLELPVAFLYMPPPGLKQATTTNNDDEPINSSSAPPSSSASSVGDVPVRPGDPPLRQRGNDTATKSTTTAISELPHSLRIEDKLPFLKNAPRAGTWVEGVQHKVRPFGIEVRNVRCSRCGQYGHKSGDRECALRDFNPHDAQRQAIEDPMRFMKSMNVNSGNASTSTSRNISSCSSSNSRVQIKPIGLKLDPNDPNQQFVSYDDADHIARQDPAIPAKLQHQSTSKDDIHEDPLAGLSEADKEKLLKRYKDLKRKLKHEWHREQQLAESKEITTNRATKQESHNEDDSDQYSSSCSCSSRSDSSSDKESLSRRKRHFHHKHKAKRRKYAPTQSVVSVSPPGSGQNDTELAVGSDKHFYQSPNDGDRGRHSQRSRDEHRPPHKRAHHRSHSPRKTPSTKRR